MCLAKGILEKLETKKNQHKNLFKGIEKVKLFLFML